MTCSAGGACSSPAWPGSRSRRWAAGSRRAPGCSSSPAVCRARPPPRSFPGSLALISASFRVEDRGRAIGAWSGLAGISTAIGPFLGGWLIDSVSWRFVFVINVPLVAVAIAVTLRHVPESRDEDATRHVDVLGGLTLSIGLAGLVYALIEGPAGASGAVVVSDGRARRGRPRCVRRDRGPKPAADGAAALFRSRQFSGANAVTLAVYAALGVATFLLVVHLQTDLGYSTLGAGATLLPITAIMLALSARAGALAQRIGPRWPMTIGPVVVGAGLALLSPRRGGIDLRLWRVAWRARTRVRSRHHRRAPDGGGARRGRRPSCRRRIGHQQHGGAHRRAARGSRCSLPSPACPTTSPAATARRW